MDYFVDFDGMRLPKVLPLKENAKARLEEIRNLDTREDDVIVATYPKSGTHWGWEIVGMLMNGKAEYIPESKLAAMLEFLPDLSLIDGRKSPRVLNTHVPYGWLPRKHIQTGGKIVHVIRNPKDVLVSLYYHITSAFLDSPPDGFQDFITYADNMKLGKEAMFGGWFAYEKAFEEAEKQDKRNTICTVHFEKLKKNPEAEIQRIAEYLEVTFCSELISDIAEKCSFKNLKEADETIKDQTLANEIVSQMGANIGRSNLFRKGEIGDWKNHFTVALNERFDALYKEEMIGSKLSFQYE